MVYRATFDYNANNSKNKVTCSWFNFPTEPTLLKKQTSSQRRTTGFARFEKTCFDRDPDQRRRQPWVILVLNLFEIGWRANIIPSSGSYQSVEHRQRHGRRRPRSTMNRSELSARIRVMSADGEFGPMNSDIILCRVLSATLVTSSSEHNRHSYLCPNDCVSSTWSLICVLL